MTTTTDIPFENQALSIPSKQLSDEKTLPDYNIQKESIIYLDTSGKTQIFVTPVHLKGITVPFVVEDSDTIGNFKEKVAEIEG